MKRFMYASKAVFVTLMLGWSGLAIADGGCPPGGDGTAECPQTNVDTIDVTGGREREENEGHCRVDCGGGGDRDTGGGNSGSGATYKQGAVKTDRRFCIGSNDTCDGWFLSATSRCGTFFSGTSAYNCAYDAEGQRADSCSSLRTANTC